MVKRERKFYSEEFKEQVLTAYQNSNESVSMVAGRFQVSRDTVGSWVYRKRRVAESKKRVKLGPSGMERQTVHEMRQESSSYGMDALCRLFGKSRQAYYERSSYAAATRAEKTPSCHRYVKYGKISRVWGQGNC